MKHFPGDILHSDRKPLTGSSGRATAGVWQVSGLARVDGHEQPFTVIEKHLSPATGSEDPRHFAYWRREALAATSGILPQHGLRAPHCHGVEETPDTLIVYWEAITPPSPATPHAAATALGTWQGSPSPDRPAWLAGHQLAQRIDATGAKGGLDFSVLPVDGPVRRRLAGAWADRYRLLGILDELPFVPSHGDYHLGNLFTGPDGEVVAIDWGCMGLSPYGADLAHLALSAPSPGGLLDAYLAGLSAAGWTGQAEDVRLGYEITAQLTGVSRVHWMLSQDMQPPAGYVDWLLSLGV
ncbi:aminoglycoside phosphotransferase family protein [Longispora albida]|uniref:aminoglycoside phosphotransferase family protein n=1 Tax=Longispora albida TaxID=203523 RepID=UPI00036384FD|nr:aminoglycoside phosphotransferase family protein [Longispora albida]